MSQPAPGIGEPMIQVTDLAKSYGSFEAVRGISFEVRRGEVLGFLGPNGAGKTTTMKILTCFMAPSSGRALVNNHDVREASLEVRRLIGYLAEDTPIYPDMTVIDYLDFVGQLRQMDAAARRRRIAEVARVCGLPSTLSRPIGQLSKGLRQRVGLAQALLHDPPILVLDEPTSGLDPNQIADIRQMIREIGQHKTVILSTHILPEVQATCGRVVIIHDGRLVADGTPAELATAQRHNAYRLLVDSGSADQQQVHETLAGIHSVVDVSELEGEAGARGLLVAAEGDVDLRRDLFTCVKDSGWVLLEMSRQQASLEDIFRHLTCE